MDTLLRTAADPLEQFIAWCGPRPSQGAGFAAQAIAEAGRAGVLAALPRLPYPTLLHALTEIGAADLPLGRLLEGHVNAVELISRLGDGRQRRRLGEDLAAGRLFGIWNTDSERPVQLFEDGPSTRLDGAKSFASGCDIVDRALISARTRSGKQLCLIGREAGFAVDLASWRPYGMEASASGTADFTHIEVGPDQLIGQPDDYHAEPWFSGGAIRFSAVQLGGARTLMEIAVFELRRRGRAADPYQSHRIAAMALAVETGILWRDRAAALFDSHRDASEILLVARMARMAIDRACADVLDVSLKAVGVGGLLAPNRFEQVYRDLTTYLRQPNPDGCMAEIGAAVAAAE